MFTHVGQPAKPELDEDELLELDELEEEDESLQVAAPSWNCPFTLHPMWVTFCKTKHVGVPLLAQSGTKFPTPWIIPFTQTGQFAGAPELDELEEEDELDEDDVCVQNAVPLTNTVPF